ncbi:MAG: hypothetical protein OEY49_04355 [Candidatus Heimdallarchaeota archaeon]|nr:hypothetical protein [Candidatus Heimdallarchaeota archaeon]
MEEDINIKFTANFEIAEISGISQEQAQRIIDSLQASNNKNFNNSTFYQTMTLYLQIYLDYSDFIILKINYENDKFCITKYDPIIKDYELFFIFQSHIQRGNLLTLREIISRRLAHDIANPLTAISMNLEFLNEMIEDENIKNTDLHDDILDSISGSLKSVSNITKMVDEYRFFNKTQPFPLQYQNQDLIDYLFYFTKINLPKQSILIWEVSNNYVEILKNKSIISRTSQILIENCLDELLINEHHTPIISINFTNDYYTIKTVNPVNLDQVNQHYFKAFNTTKNHNLGLGINIIENNLQMINGTFSHKIQDNTIIFQVKIPI